VRVNSLADTAAFLNLLWHQTGGPQAEGNNLATFSIRGYAIVEHRVSLFTDARAERAPPAQGTAMPDSVVEKKATEQQPYLAYMLRLWQVQDGAKSVWRVSLESPHTGERLVFATMDLMVAFLREKTSAG